MSFVLQVCFCFFFCINTCVVTKLLVLYPFVSIGYILKLNNYSSLLFLLIWPCYIMIVTCSLLLHINFRSNEPAVNSTSRLGFFRLHHTLVYWVLLLVFDQSSDTSCFRLFIGHSSTCVTSGPELPVPLTAGTILIL